jgi:dienelactone hydrolase
MEPRRALRCCDTIRGMLVHRAFSCVVVVSLCACEPVLPMEAPEPFVQRDLDHAELVRAMGLDLYEGFELGAPSLGGPAPYDGYAVHGLTYEVIPGFRSSAALWLPEGEGPFPGVLVLPGHFGDGKSAGECQDIAHSLAARGVVVLAVDMPGVEEWATPERQLHFDEGAFNRAALVAAGTSALGLQIHMARRGLDTLQQVAPIGSMAATGASGGAVLAFYLALVDERVEAIALASPVNIPRPHHEGGCFCDLLVGHSGPSPQLLELLETPSLWLNEHERDRPEGLPEHARFELVEGVHSYTGEMRALAVPWLEEQLGHTPPDARRASRALRKTPVTPGEAIQSSTEHGAMSIFELALRVGRAGRWEPRLDLELPVETRCEGEGRPVVVVGAEEADLEALQAAGWRTCGFTLPEDETWEPRAWTRGLALADRQASALRQLSDSLDGAPIYAVGHWTIPAGAVGVPWVVRDPLISASQIDPDKHPPWVHTPGLWWGELEPLRSTALAGAEGRLAPAALVEALEPMKFWSRLPPSLRSPRYRSRPLGVEGERAE